MFHTTVDSKTTVVIAVASLFASDPILGNQEALSANAAGHCQPEPLVAAPSFHNMSLCPTPSFYNKLELSVRVAVVKNLGYQQNPQGIHYRLGHLDCLDFQRQQYLHLGD